jgi:hypothetical protein
MSGVYLIQDGGGLVEMRESPYDSEDLLQKLLAEYPNLLAGDQIDDARPRRWLLVTREMAVPGEEGGAGRWSLDHLFLDQDAIPTLVEVKRSTDTRIRREVVGQMLDYAANAVVYWPIEKIQASFESLCSTRQIDPDAVVSQLVEGSIGVEEFWQKVKTNLQAGRIRLLFVADEIPTELRRVVEFLNGQMDPAVVLALEVKQFVGQGMKTLVPRVLGQTEAARQKKNPERTEVRQWDEESFFADLRRRHGEPAEAVARRILEWANTRGLRTWWGQGKQDGSFYPGYDGRSGRHLLFSVWTNGSVEIQFQHMKYPPFNEDRMRMDLARRLSAIDRVSIPEDALKRRPSFKLSLLVQPGALEQFLGVFDWMLSEIKKVEAYEPGVP